MVTEMIGKLTDNSVAMVIFSGGNTNKTNSSMQASLCLIKIITTYKRQIDMIH